MNIEQQVKKFFDDIPKIKSNQKLELYKNEAFGRKGFMTQALKNLNRLELEARKVQGQKLNQQKRAMMEALDQHKHNLISRDRKADMSASKSDASLPEAPIALRQGRLHPIWQVMDEVIDIFAFMGFAFESGPDIESEYYNFTALNIGADHPSRQEQDSFFFPTPNQDGHNQDSQSQDSQNQDSQNQDSFCLRTHTSPVQIRVMEKGEPPFRFIAPGRVYRRDSDQTHTPMFHQIEGVAIGKNIHLAHLKWLLHFIFAEIF